MTDSTGENRELSRDVAIKILIERVIPVRRTHPLFAMSTRAPCP
jgi:hypothetical protein